MFSNNSAAAQQQRQSQSHHHQNSSGSLARQLQQGSSSHTLLSGNSRATLPPELAAELYEKYGLVAATDRNTLTIPPNIDHDAGPSRLQFQQQLQNNQQSQQVRPGFSRSMSAHIGRPGSSGKGMNFHRYQQRQPMVNGKAVTSPHSGHFMTSNLDDEEDAVKGDKGEGMEEPEHVLSETQRKIPGYNFAEACQTPQNSYRFNSTFNRKDANDFDSSLSKLFACMTLAYGR